MRRSDIEAALTRAQTEALPDTTLTRCAVARMVLAFLEELDRSASWWQRLVLGLVRDLVRGIVADCRPQD